MMKAQPNMAWRPFHRSALTETPHPYELNSGNCSWNISVPCSMKPPGDDFKVESVYFSTTLLTLDTGATRAVVEATRASAATVRAMTTCVCVGVSGARRRRERGVC